MNQPDHRLVGVLNDEVLAVFLGHHQVQHTPKRHQDQDQELLADLPNDSPGVVHAEVDLLSELDGLELLGAEDDVPGTVLDVVPADILVMESWRQ